jgi:glycosyltransferase involved in cell wall biosynthesis
VSKVLLITYYWPPAGGAGVQRWLKMSKYLSQKFEFHVFCPDGADYPVKDLTLEKEVSERITVIKKKIWEPYELASKFSKRNTNFKKGQLNPQSDRSIMDHLSIFVRSNFFIPDGRAAWINPSFNQLKSYVTKEKIDVIISTGPPHSVHVIALKLKRKYPKIKWIADFRDPWTEIDYFDKLNLTRFALKKHKKLELDVLQHADKVVCVSPSWSESLARICGRPVSTIFNGFDQSDFHETNTKSTDFLLVYSGLVNRDRSPYHLWSALNELIQEDSEFADNFKLRFIGTVDPFVQAQIETFQALLDRTEFKGYLPHSDSIKCITEAALLLLLINNTANQKGILPGKLFEYLATGVPILCIGPSDGDISRILKETESGTVVSFEDTEAMKKEIQHQFNLFKNGQAQRLSTEVIKRYSRETAAREFETIIHELLDIQMNK